MKQFYILALSLFLFSIVGYAQEKDAQSYIQKAESLVEEGDLKDALKYFDKAIKLEPENASAWLNKGIVYTQLDQTREAVRCFNKVLELDPNNQSARFSKRVAVGKEMANQTSSFFGDFMLILGVVLGATGISVAIVAVVRRGRAKKLDE